MCIPCSHMVCRSSSFASGDMGPSESEDKNGIITAPVVPNTHLHLMRLDLIFIPSFVGCSPDPLTSSSVFTVMCITYRHFAQKLLPFA
jgi:hypothetical protein